MRRDRVLIIEDDPLNMELARDLLAAAGFRVEGAERAEAGLALARAHPPDVVLMDISLPGMDGLEATRRLKADPALRDIPVVAVSSHAMKGDEDKAREAGCAAYITKPIDTRTLPLQVSAALAARRTAKEPR